jgi:hypothetical protein
MERLRLLEMRHIGEGLTFMIQVLSLLIYIFSMTFHRGQGGNLAIKDADEFIIALLSVQNGEQTLKEAIDKYDKGVVERGQEVEISKKQAHAFHDYANFMNSPVMSMGIKPAGS